MADEITRVDFYMCALPHKTGEAARVLAAFKETGINLTAFSGYRKSARNAGVVFFVPEKTADIAKVAKKAGLEIERKGRGFWVNGTDRVGAVAEALGKVAAAGINVESCHAVCAGAGRYGAVITLVESSELRKAAKVLGA